MSYECDTCTRCFATQRACDQHMTAVGHHDDSYKCDNCSRRFASWSACKQHMTALDHWIWEHECETCNMRFVHWYDAKEHMEEEDHFSYPYDCETCDYCFRSASARDDHQEDEGHYEHLWCKDCDRYFQNENNLRQHRNSRLHRGTPVTCPFCKGEFTTASGVSTHLESSSCPMPALRQRDPHGIITERLLEWHDEPSLAAEWHPASAWNGFGYECYICHRTFNIPQALRQHITSPVHQAPLYHCPNKNGGCAAGRRKFLTLAALFNHLESESCGYARFEAVQKNVSGFLTGGSQRLIAL